MHRKDEENRDLEHHGDDTPSREARFCRLVKVQIICDAHPNCEAIIRNVSANGLCAKSATPLPAGERVIVQKEGFGEVQGTVRWSCEQEYGVQFDHPIDVDQFNFGSDNKSGHFVKKIENAHVWKGFADQASHKRPGFSHRYAR